MPGRHWVASETIEPVPKPLPFLMYPVRAPPAALCPHLQSQRTSLHEFTEKGRSQRLLNRVGGGPDGRG